MLPTASTPATTFRSTPSGVALFRTLREQSLLGDSLWIYPVHVTRLCLLPETPRGGPFFQARPGRDETTLDRSFAAAMSEWQSPRDRLGTNDLKHFYYISVCFFLQVSYSSCFWAIESITFLIRNFICYMISGTRRFNIARFNQAYPHFSVHLLSLIFSNSFNQILW